jgi:hypothetical protein
MKYNTDETQIALNALCREFEIDVHHAWRIRQLFEVSVGRIFVRDMRQQDDIDPECVFTRSGDVYSIDGMTVDGRYDVRTKWTQRALYFSHEYYAEVRHVLDWLWLANAENQSWLKNVDELGRPKKLLKFATLGDTVREADRWMGRRLPSVRATKALTAEDVRWEMDLGSGYYLVQLLSSDALDDESARMHHCIGLGSYDSHLSQPGTGFFSIRNPNDRAVATLHIENSVIRQAAGLGNTRPAPEVAALIEELRRAQGWEYPVLRGLDGRGDVIFIRPGRRP